jgi:GntR family transcriptional regulator
MSPGLLTKRKEPYVKDFEIDPQSPVAQYAQIEACVRGHIASGRLKPGDALPSVRAMSMELNVNPNTVTKAYRDLQLLGFIKSTRGEGCVITKAAVSLSASTRAEALQHLNAALRHCVRCGMGTADLKGFVAETVAKCV